MKPRSVFLLGLFLVPGATALSLSAEPNKVTTTPEERADVSLNFSDVNGTASVKFVESPDVEVFLQNLTNKFIDGQKATFTIPTQDGEDSTITISASDNNGSATKEIPVEYRESVTQIGEFNTSDREILRFPEENVVFNLSEDDLNDSDGSTQDTGSARRNRNGEVYEFETNGDSDFQVSSSKSSDFVVGKDLVTVDFNLDRVRLQRGQFHGFRTINNRTGEPVPFTAIDFRGLDGLRTDGEGEEVLEIPFDYDRNRINYTITGTRSSEFNESVLRFDSGSFGIRTRQQLENENSLSLQGVSGTVPGGGFLNGSVSRQSGEYGSVQVILDSSTEDFRTTPDQSGRFSFPIPKSLESNLSVRAIDTRDRSLNTSESTVEVIGDRDEDLVLDNKDSCVNRTGLPEYDGCPTAVLDLGFQNPEDETTSIFDLEPNTKYTMNVFSESDTQLTRSFTVTLEDRSENSTRTLTVPPEGKEVFFEDSGEHLVSLDGEGRFNGFEKTVIVESQGGFPVLLFTVLIGVGGLAAVFLVIPPRLGSPVEKKETVERKLFELMGR